MTEGLELLLLRHFHSENFRIRTLKMLGKILSTYRIDAYKAPLLIKPPVQQNLNKPPLFWTKSPLFEACMGKNF